MTRQILMKCSLISCTQHTIGHSSSKQRSVSLRKKQQLVLSWADGYTFSRCFQANVNLACSLFQSFYFKKQVTVFETLSPCFPGAWTFLWLVCFCLLASQWSRTHDVRAIPEDAARATIAFSFFSIATWVSTKATVFAFLTYSQAWFAKTLVRKNILLWVEWLTVVVYEQENISESFTFTATN